MLPEVIDESFLNNNVHEFQQCSGRLSGLLHQEIWAGDQCASFGGFGK